MVFVCRDIDCKSWRLLVVMEPTRANMSKELYTASAKDDDVPEIERANKH